MNFYLRLLTICVLGLITWSCETKQKVKPWGDYSLDPDFEAPKADHTTYYTELENSTDAIPFNSSFPVSIIVGKRYRSFDQIPPAAQKPQKSALGFRLSESCTFFMMTRNVQAVRYMYTSKWVKAKEVIPNIPLRFKPGENMSIQFWAELEVVIPKKYEQGCRRKLFGKRTFLGKFHMLRSSSQLLASPRTPPLKLKAYDSFHLTPIWIYWSKNSAKPRFKNDLEFPAVVKSPFFQAKAGDRGFYYASFQALLEAKHTKNRLIDMTKKMKKKAASKNKTGKNSNDS